MALSAKHEAFITEYLKCFNATQAAINAGYSENSAGVTGHRLLKDANISASIREKMAEHAMSAEEVLYHLTMIARGDIDAVTDDHGNLDKARARALGMTGLIKKIKQRSITTEESDIHEAEIEVYDRLKALELLAKYHDLINKSTVRVTDWRDEVVDLLRMGKVTPEEVTQELGPSLAEELFKSAGIRAITGG